MRLHRWAGLSMAGFLVIAGLTGSIIAFDTELDAWLNPDLFSVAKGKPPLPATVLKAHVEEADPRLYVAYLPLKFADGEAAALGVGPRVDPSTGEPYSLDFDELFVDPSNGAVLGKRAWGSFGLDRRHLIPFLYEFHHNLYMPGKWGIWLMGGIAILWTLDCLFGLYLTLPRGRPFFGKWKRAWRIKWGASGYRLNFDIHRAGGLWMWVVLLLVAFSGAFLNLYGEVFRPAIEVFSPITPTPYSASKPLQEWEERQPAFSFANAVERGHMEASERGWPSPSHVYHVRKLGFYSVAFREAQFGRGTGLGSPRLYLDDGDGRDLGAYTPGTGTGGDLFVHVQMPLHSGEIAGLTGKIVICLSGIGLAVLVVTGVVIWYRKRHGRKPASRRERRSSVLVFTSRPAK